MYSLYKVLLAGRIWLDSSHLFEKMTALHNECFELGRESLRSTLVLLSDRLEVEETHLQ